MYDGTQLETKEKVKIDFKYFSSFFRIFILPLLIHRNIIKAVEL